ncbi:uncharacterized protein SPPG_08464 [Spizellomyces punctatus DAOM BR117]|uniref:Uncharacterized protein n=1 Tax=Spizellomyces punctatus (strain DAOM BR117) TaxID=645134 RepID=A0A0L0H5V0_SPIPD|nr:uncharacterized protein SPPG_08464 [Spizellomyces punctatus DAOM BR117]KNC96073.1 hypothetical protein SPPG_08464 [Spizellomyces punctatus DAOM BR117]|eukprot:XP_016604113.1 hypothetical protein SPPG_08464 [Spizellomyces punctatus DAOM BR117]
MRGSSIHRSPDAIEPFRQEVDQILSVRCGSLQGTTSDVVHGRPYPAAYADLVQDVLDDKQYESALRIIDAFASSRYFPPTSILFALFSLSTLPRCLSEGIPQAAVAILQQVLKVHGSAPFYQLFSGPTSDDEQTATGKVLWDVTADAWGLWQTGITECLPGLAKVQQGRMVMNFLLELVRTDIGLAFHKDSIGTSLVATLLGRHRKINMSSAVEVISSMLQFELADSEVLRTAAQWVSELSLLVFADHIEMKSFLRMFTPTLRSLDRPRLYEFLEYLPFSHLKVALADLILTQLCVYPTSSRSSRKASLGDWSTSCSAHAVSLCLPQLNYHRHATPSKPSDWDTVLQLFTIIAYEQKTDCPEEKGAIRYSVWEMYKRAEQGTEVAVNANELEIITLVLSS